MLLNQGILGYARKVMNCYRNAPLNDKKHGFHVCNIATCFVHTSWHVTMTMFKSIPKAEWCIFNHSFHFSTIWWIFNGNLQWFQETSIWCYQFVKTCVINSLGFILLILPFASCSGSVSMCPGVPIWLKEISLSWAGKSERHCFKNSVWLYIVYILLNAYNICI